MAVWSLRLIVEPLIKNSRSLPEAVFGQSANKPKPSSHRSTLPANRGRVVCGACAPTTRYPPPHHPHNRSLPGQFPAVCNRPLAVRRRLPEGGRCQAERGAKRRREGCAGVVPPSVWRDRSGAKPGAARPGGTRKNARAKHGRKTLIRKRGIVC